MLSSTPKNQVRGIGVCIGLLAAAVAATACTARDVVRLGLECVAISFRLGIELWYVSPGACCLYDSATIDERR